MNIKNGMKLKFVDRNEYRLRNNKVYIKKLKKTYMNSLFIPEGGTNDKGIKGCEEILSDDDRVFFDVICVPVGSGGTFSGLINSSSKKQKITIKATTQASSELLLKKEYIVEQKQKPLI